MYLALRISAHRSKKGRKSSKAASTRAARVLCVCWGRVALSGSVPPPPLERSLLYAEQCCNNRAALWHLAPPLLYSPREGRRQEGESVCAYQWPRISCNWAKARALARHDCALQQQWRLMERHLPTTRSSLTRSLASIQLESADGRGHFSRKPKCMGIIFDIMRVPLYTLSVNSLQQFRNYSSTSHEAFDSLTARAEDFLRDCFYVRVVVIGLGACYSSTISLLSGGGGNTIRAERANKCDNGGTR